MKRFFLFAGILAVLGGGYMLYRWLYGENEGAIWTLIPSDAIGVYETKSLGDTWEALQGHPAFSLGKAWYGYGKRNTAILDSLLAQQDFFSRFSLDLPFALSMHRTGKESFDFVYYSHIQAQDKQELLATWLSQLQKTPFKQSTRNYHGHTLTELSLGGSTAPLAYITHKGYFIASLTPLLVEDVIRRLDEKQKAPLESHRKDLRTHIQWEQHKGMLHIDMKRFTKLLEVFTNDEPSIPRVWPVGIAQLSVHILRESLLMNGSALSLDTLHQTPSGFITRKSQELPFAPFVPNHTLSLFAYFFEDAKAWNHRMLTWWREQHVDVVEQRIQLFARYQVDIDALFAHIRNYAGIGILKDAIGHDSSLDKLFFLHTKDMANTQDMLNTWTAHIGTSTTASLAPYRGYTFHHVPVADLPYLLFGDPFLGFPELFYITVDNFLIAASSLSTLKDLIDHMEREAVWSKTPAIDGFLKNTSSRAHLALYVNTSKYAGLLPQTLKEPWKSFFMRHTWKEPRLLALQMEGQQHTWRMHFLWQPPIIPDIKAPPPSHAPLASTPVSSTPADAAYTIKRSISLSHPLLTKPFAMYHPRLRKYHIFLQDSTYQLYMLSENERIAWFLPLGEKLQSPVYDIDYYKNGRIQYLFLTTHRLHILDPTGTYVKGFPRALPTQDTLAFLSLVDYSKNKNYRFFVADAKGRLFITDKQGNPLEGWTPKALPYPLVTAPVHVRTQAQRDAMIALQTDGTLQVFRRNGTTYPGFPLKLKPFVSAPPVFSSASTLAAASLSVLTQDGEWIEVSLEGNIKQRQQVAPAAEETTFRLIHETTGNNVLFVRQDPQTLSVFDQAGLRLFEKETFLSAAFTGQYYRFRNGQPMLIFNDPLAEKTYFYDLEGVELLPSPISGKFKVGVLYNSGQGAYQIFRVHRNNYTVLEHTP